MNSNLLKPEAQRQRDKKDIRDAFISFGFVILFIVSIVYIAIRAAEYEAAKEHVKTHQR